MQEFGGSFVKQLADLALRADPINLAKIKAAWPDYWAQYVNIAANSEQIRETARRLRWANQDPNE